jgi:hypothetical protein
MTVVPMEFRELVFERPITADQATRSVVGLLCDPTAPRLVFELWGQAGKVRHLLGAAPGVHQAAARTLGATVASLAADRPAVDTAKRVVIRNRWRPLDSQHLEVSATSILRALAAARCGEQVVLQIVVGQRLAPSVVADRVSQPFKPSQLLTGSEGRLGSDDRAALARKLALPGACTAVRLGVSAATANRRQRLGLGVLGALREIGGPGVTISLETDKPLRFDAARPPWLRPIRLNAAELTAMLAIPVGSEDLPGLPPVHPRRLPVSGTQCRTGRVFGFSDHPASYGQPVGLSTSDGLTHLSVVAPTGAGKSTLLHHLAAADLAGGYGLALIDPKGDLVQAVLGSVPATRHGDVVVLDPTDQTRPVGFNPLRVGAGQSPELVADAVTATFAQLWPETGVRTLDVLSAAVSTLTRRNANLTASGHPNRHTLLDVPRLLGDGSFRRQVVGQLDDEVLAGFWAGFEDMSAAQAGEVTAPVMRRLRQFLTPSSLRAVLGQAEPGFDLSAVFDSVRPLAVLVPLNKALLGQQAAQLFGALVVSRLWQATLRRAAIPANGRRPVSVILDEAPDLLRLPLSLGDALAQARGYGVGFTLAAQFRSQWPPGLREAVDANTLSKICFRQPAADARAMAAVSGGQVTAEDLMALGQYETYASLARNGHPGPWLSARTLPPPAPTSLPAEIRQISRQRHGQATTNQRTPELDTASSDSGQTARSEQLGRARRQT